MTSANQAGLVEALDALVAKWHLLKHPFYQAWTAGTLDRSNLQLYAAQYYQHVRAFPEHLRALAARSEDGLRPIVEDNLAEEDFPGRTHPQLWREFAAAVGVGDAELDSAAPLPGTQALVETFGRLSREGAPAEAVAAFYAYEAQIPEIAAQKISGLCRFYGVNDTRGLAYFAVHEEADVRHRAAWRGWLEQQPAEAKDGAVRAAEEALRALWGALDAVSPACP
ncbi:MAG: CADD family putative folate metabolism protein [Candidatus Acidiferrales bacterium]